MKKELPKLRKAAPDVLERMPKPTRDCLCLEMKGGTLMPVYRNGDIIIVSPKARLRKGDRVIVKLKGLKTHFVVGFYLGKRGNKVSVTLINQWPPGKPTTVPTKYVESISRILWATQ
jgi:phage repressor protein C with HTH and peptisase S24 domain